MLKHLAILAVLLAVLCPVPILGEATDQRSQSGHDPKEQAANGKTPSEPTLTILEKDCNSEPFKNDADCNASKDKERTVAISKLPTTNVTVERNPKRDFADWVAYGGGLGVLLVSIWGINVALRGVKATEKAADAALKSAEAALAQIEMVKSKERAQLRIEFGDMDFLFDKKVGGYPIAFRVTLDGITRAYIVEESIVAYIAPSPIERKCWRTLGIPRNFTPESSPFESFTTIQNDDILPENEMDAAKIALAQTGRLTTFMNGRIWYRDIFGDEWILEIDRYWDHLTGMWGPTGSGKNDELHKIEKRAIQSQAPQFSPPKLR